MIKTMSVVGVVAVLAILGLVAPPSRPASAGANLGVNFTCTTSGTNTTCIGSLRAARVLPNTVDHTRFRMASDGTLSFTALFNNFPYACSFGSTASQRLAAAIAIGYNAYFSVTMNNTGTCTSAFIDNDSGFLSNPLPINPS